MSQAIKKGIRKAMLTKRKELSATCNLTSSIPKMIHHINKLISGDSNNRVQPVLAGYFPIKYELDIVPILSYFSAQSCPVTLPSVSEKKSPLSFFQWEDLKASSLVSGRFNIPVPDSTRCKQLYPNVLLVPLVAFTYSGVRLGYGGGYYDRTISMLKSQGKLWITIGVAYEGQRCDYIPKEEQDQCLDAVVTEKQVYFQGKPTLL